MYRDHSQSGPHRSGEGLSQVGESGFGVMQLLTIFFRDLFEGKVPSKHENKLRLCFKDLLKKSGDALKRNRQFIKKDQEAYQNELENRYNEFDFVEFYLCSP